MTNSESNEVMIVSSWFPKSSAEWTGMEIRQYAVLVRRYWAMLVASVLIALAVGTGVFLLRTPEFDASTRVFVAVKSSPDASQLSQGGTYAQEIVSSYASVANSPRILSPVIAELRLGTTAVALAKRVSASSTAGTVIITIDVLDPSPKRAAAIADAVARQLAASVSVFSPTTDSSGSTVQITQLENAAVPQSAAGASVVFIALVALVIGLVVGMVLVVLREVLDTRVRTVDEVTGLVAAPLLGFTSRDNSGREAPLAMTRSVGDLDAERYKTLRANLQFVDPGKRSRAWVVTSSLEGEGKTVAVANLAIALSELSLRVIVVDADLRRPHLDGRFGVENSVGFTDVIIGRCDLDEAVQTWGDSGLSILPSGSIPPNPSELLQSEQAEALLGKLREAYDVVLFDSPPLLPVSDAAVLARLTDGVILLAAYGRVRKQQLRASEQVLMRAGAQLIGTVVTMVPRRGGSQYGGYGYGYGA